MKPANTFFLLMMLFFAGIHALPASAPHPGTPPAVMATPSLKNQAASLSFGIPQPENPEPGQTVILPVLATGFIGGNRLHAATIHVTYDSSVLQYSDYASSIIANADRHNINGNFSLAWSSLSGVEADNVTLFSLSFVYQGGITDISFRPDTEMADNDGLTIATSLSGTTLGTEPESFTITAEAVPAAGGSVSGTGTFAFNSNITLSASPAAGYVFTAWYEEQSQLSTAQQLQVLVNANRHFEARFELQSYTLAYQAGTGGTINGVALQTVTHGSNGTAVQAVPLSGYSFTGWSDGRTDNPRTDTNVTADISVTAQFSASAYNITAAVVPPGAGSVEGTGSFAFNTVTTLTATAAPAYNFAGWYEGGILAGSGPQLQVAVTGHRHFEAHFTLKQYTLTYSAGTGGTVTGNSSQTVDHGTNGTAVEAVPVQGYTFVQWSDGRTDNPRADTNVTTDISVTAIFSGSDVVITATVVPAGAGTVSGDGSFTINTTTTLNASPAEGYQFVGWYEGGTLLGSNAQLSVTASSNRIIEARFQLRSYTLTYNAAAGGRIQGSASQSVQHGSSGTAVEAVPDDGYYFAGWSDGRDDNPRTDTGVTTSINVTASFAELGFQLLTLIANPAGAGTLFGGGNYYDGEEAYISAQSAFGYTFVSWTRAGQVVSTNPQYNFVMHAAQTLVANFNPLPFTITANVIPQEGGVVEGTGTYNYNSYTNLIAIPQEGYAFSVWKEDGVAIGSDPQLEVLVTGDRHFEASFDLVTHTVLYEAGEGGSISGAALQLISHGSDASPVTATPDEGYHFVSWDDGVTDNPRTDTSVTADIYAVALFALNEYEVAVSSTPEGHGVVSIVTDKPFTHGSKVTVSASPLHGYAFVHWLEEDEVVSETANYQFTITADRNLTAVFEPLRFAVDATAVPEEGGSISGTGTFDYNTTAVLTAITAAGYNFTGWVENGILLGTAQTIEVLVQDNRALEAHFALQTFAITATATPAEGGTVSGTGTFGYGTQVLLTAMPANGYRFEGWYESGITAGEDPELLIAAEADRHLTAAFVKQTFMVRFMIVDIFGNPVEDATVEVEDHAYDKGMYLMEDVMPGTYRYAVSKEGYFPVEGSFDVEQEDLVIPVVLRVDDTSVPAFGSQEISVYPNPVCNMLNVSAREQVRFVNVFDLGGRLLASYNADLQVCDMTIDMAGMPNGVYLLQVVTIKNATTTRVVVAR